MSVLSICLMIGVVIPFLPRWRPSGRHKGYISHQHCKAQTSTCTQSFTRKLSYDVDASHLLIACSLYPLSRPHAYLRRGLWPWHLHLLVKLSLPHRLEDEEARNARWSQASPRCEHNLDGSMNEIRVVEALDSDKMVFRMNWQATSTTTTWSPLDWMVQERSSYCGWSKMFDRIDWRASNINHDKMFSTWMDREGWQAGDDRAIRQQTRWWCSWSWSKSFEWLKHDFGNDQANEEDGWRNDTRHHRHNASTVKHNKG